MEVIPNFDVQAGRENFREEDLSGLGSVYWAFRLTKLGRENLRNYSFTKTTNVNLLPL